MRKGEQQCPTSFARIFMGIEENVRVGPRHGLALVMLAAATWGTIGVTAKAIDGLVTTTPLSVGFFRLALAAPALLFSCWLILGREMFQVRRRDVGMMTLIGLMTALYQVCFFGAIARAGAAAAAVMTVCMGPVMVALLSIYLTGERLTAFVGLALGCALAGTALLVAGRPNNSMQSATVSGVGLALGGALAQAILTLVSRALAGRYHPLQPIAIGFSVGAVLLLLWTLATGFVVQYPWMGWVLLGYLGFVPTAAAYGLFLAGLRSTPATTASVATLMEPLTSTVLAWLLCGERLGMLAGLGILLLFSAMGLLVGSRERQ
jgi:drug/metabolite transporter, DME family